MKPLTFTHLKHTSILGNIIYVTLVCFIFLPIFNFAQFEKDYQPIKEATPLPPEFAVNAREDFKKNLLANKLLSEVDAPLYYARMTYFKHQLMQSGKLYLQNEISLYVDSVVSKLLKSEPKLKSEIKVYLTRFTQANAHCFPDGSIFLNIGLLASLKNEAQLAFILGHEIAHYHEQHSIKDLNHLKKIQEGEVNYSNSGSTMFRSLRFSRESEFDADSWSLQLLQAAGYDVTMAAESLLIFKEDTDTIGKINLQKLFSSDLFKVDTTWYNKTEVNYAKSNAADNEDDFFSSGKVEDLFQTHPDIDKRIEALQLMAKALKANPLQRIKGEASYLRIQLLASFEVIENSFREQDYLTVIIRSTLMAERFPANVYLATMSTNSIYWLSYYKELSSEKNLVFSGNTTSHVTDYFKLYAMVNKMDLKDLKKLAYSFSVSKHEAFNTSGQLLFYLAVCTENYLGKNSARNYYKEYLQNYPEGHYVSYVRGKL